MKYIMSLDQGTTSSRCILFDKAGNICASAQKEFRQIFPKPGWVEHDAEEIWSTTLEVSRLAMEKLGVAASDIAGIGITNQRETTVIWDKETGKPIANAIVWQCRRTSEMIEGLVRAGYSEMIREKTGLVPDAYFSGSKLRWLLDHVPGARERAERGELLFGTVDSWLIWKLTGGKTHVTDYTNASRTMIFDIHSLKWDKELLSALDIPECMLPRVCGSSEIYGYADLRQTEVPIAGIAGDQQAALFGQTCFEAGDIKNTYGTGCFMLMNTGDVPAKSKSGLVTTIACGPDGRAVYALEGSVFVGGAVVQWLRDEMRFFAESRDTQYFASKVKDTCGVYLVPAFTGLGAPYWDMDARGAIVGITRGTKREHIIRAALESIAYQCTDVISAMRKDAGSDITALYADGGAAENAFLMQFQADVADVRIICPSMKETTALGAAYLAGLAAGVWSGTDEIKRLGRTETEFVPDMDEQKRAALLSGWHKAVKRSLGWAERQ